MKNFIIVDGISYDAEIYAVKAETKEKAEEIFKNFMDNRSQIYCIHEFKEEDNNVIYVTTICE